VNGDEADDSEDQAGAAYVFVRTGASWAQQAYIKASNTDAYDEFGLSLALSADTLVVGTPRERSGAVGVNGNQADNGVTNAGAAYVFARSGASWSQQAYIKASNTEALDNFAESLALDGDTLVVGAPEESSAAVGVGGDQSSNAAWKSGAAYVFTRSGALWAQQAYLKASNTGELDFFGQVALHGATLVVGAHGERSFATGINGPQSDDSVSDAGAVYIFE